MKTWKRSLAVALGLQMAVVTVFATTMIAAPSDAEAYCRSYRYCYYRYGRRYCYRRTRCYRRRYTRRCYWRRRCYRNRYCRYRYGRRYCYYRRYCRRYRYCY